MAATKSKRTVAAILHRCCAVGVIVLLGLGVGSCDIYQRLYPTASITIKNEANQPVVLLCLASQEDTDWGDSVLSEPIPPAGAYTISDIERRIIKVKAVLEDDQTIIKDQIDLTSSEVYILFLEVGTNEGS